MAGSMSVLIGMVAVLVVGVVVVWCARRLSACALLVLVCCILLAAVGVGVAAPLSSSLFSTAARLSAVRSPAASDSILGAPTLSASFIDRVLAAAGSPAVGTGVDFYQDSLQTGIDDAFPLALYGHESTFGTRGVARLTHSVGNIRCAGYPTCLEGFRSYASYAEAVADLYHVLLVGYVQQGRTTIAAILPVYAPAADHNDPAAYITSVEQFMAAWRRGVVLV
jgi:hypothetical protein